MPGIHSLPETCLRLFSHHVLPYIWQCELGGGGRGEFSDVFLELKSMDF